jgi:hypothetical protein
MRYTFGASAVVEGFEVFVSANHMEPLFSNIYVCHHILPSVLFANQEFILGGESDPATFANETNEGYVAL